MQYIEAAYRGRVNMVQTVFGHTNGQAQAPVKAASKRPMTGKLFDALLGGRSK